LYKEAIARAEKQMEEEESQEPIIPHVQEGELYLQSAKYLLKLLGP